MARRWNNGRVPLPPMPADPSVCRWCDGPIVNGACREHCLPADTREFLLYELRCSECDRAHRTGRVSHNEPCWECCRREAQIVAGQYQGGRDKLTRYDRDMVQAGMQARRSKESA